MKCFVVLAAVIAAASALRATAEWEAFKIRHNKTYQSAEEEAYRNKIFAHNKDFINKHNAEFEQGRHRYKLEVNHFADLLHPEFVKTMNGFHGRRANASKARGEGATYLTPLAEVRLPKSVDWRQKGYVTPVKNQGACGSCWAFSTTGSLEGQHFRKLGKLVSLSEQNLVDCSAKFGNHGCNGGLMDQAFQYIRSNHGIDTESTYPYEAVQGDCVFKTRDVGATDKGFVDVLPRGDEDKLKEVVASVGPVSVAIDASHRSFQFYSQGVYDEPECDNQQLDHGVLVVGYGTSKDGVDYWLVKNSWATTWGEEGYVKMVRNKADQCGVASQASYPLV